MEVGGNHDMIWDRKPTEGQISETVKAVVTYPRRRFGIRYKDGQAILTVAPDAALLG